MSVSLASPESQELFEEIVSNVRREVGATLEVSVTSKKLVPFDIIVTLSIQVAARLLYDVMQRIAREFSEKRIKCNLDYGSRQTVAEAFLLKNGVKEPILEEKSDSPGQTEFRFRDKRSKQHHLIIFSDGSCKYWT